MRYVRNSALRRAGASRNTINLRARLRRTDAALSAEQRVSANLLDTIADVRAVVVGVNTPNGTTKKVARILADI